MGLLNDGIRQKKNEQEKQVTVYGLWKINPGLKLMARQNLLDSQKKSFVLISPST